MWVSSEERKNLISALPGGEKGALLLRDLLKLKDCDLFDLFAEIGFGVTAKTRGERVLAFDYKNKDWHPQNPLGKPSPLRRRVIVCRGRKKYRAGIVLMR